MEPSGGSLSVLYRISSLVLDAVFMYRVLVLQGPWSAELKRFAILKRDLDERELC